MFSKLKWAWICLHVDVVCESTYPYENLNLISMLTIYVKMLQDKLILSIALEIHLI